MREPPHHTAPDGASQHAGKDQPCWLAADATTAASGAASALAAATPAEGKAAARVSHPDWNSAASAFTGYMRKRERRMVHGTGFVVTLHLSYLASGV